ncbi:hypothetical protein SD37_08065 [Amycolatopsis orientalis]|uniref:Uncharacterized protein n=1 Tax=Amycolatopsis orientalis TaxID=31958 RepID=A0A193BTW9_AMYOR|nr:hypothetical protein SD37_08065 [Amycolatopsis orientalis]
MPVGHREVDTPVRQPRPNWTQLVTTSLGGGPAAITSAKASVVSLPPGPSGRTWSTTTPRSASASLGYSVDGNSRSGMTTRSPAAHSSPFATNPRPVLVFLTKATSRAGTPISVAAETRARSTASLWAVGRSRRD